MHRLSREELNTIIQQLDEAIRNHNEWFESLNRQIICKLPYDLRNTRDGAHRECLFGQWLYNYLNPNLREHPALEAIEREHRIMHQSVANMLSSMRESGNTSADEYDRFSIAMQRLRLEINTLKRELEATYYSIDSLTGANSRIGMLTHLREQMELVKRGAQQFSIAMFDLDHFKQINDTHGHSVGDRVLMGISRLILNNIRTYDHLYRYGGDEFLLILPHTDAFAVTPIVERLREEIQYLPLTTEQCAPLQITVSIGVCTIDTGLTVEDAIHRADQALYVAKGQGRNCSQFWTPAMTNTVIPPHL